MTLIENMTHKSQVSASNNLNDGHFNNFNEIEAENYGIDLSLHCFVFES